MGQGEHEAHDVTTPKAKAERLRKERTNKSPLRERYERAHTGTFVMRKRFRLNEVTGEPELVPVNEKPKEKG